MSTLTAVLTHLNADRVRANVELLELVASSHRFVLCYAGDRDEFSRIDFEPKVFIDDLTLRGPARYLQSWTRIFEAVWADHFDNDPSLDSLYFVEYDHLILDGSFEERLRDLARRTGADFLGKNCVDRTATNWEHYVRFRRDPRVIAHLRSLSVREDPDRLFGCLGDGMWLSRAALEAYVGVGVHPQCYCEPYVPSLLHHLGFRVVNIDAHSDLYRSVREGPPFDVDDAVRRFEDGSIFLHPVKDDDVVRRLHDALARPAVVPGEAVLPRIG